MLKFLRKSSNKKKIFLLLAIAIIPPFLFWGISLSDKEGESPSTLGMIDNNAFSLKEYLASYKAVQHGIQMRYGERAGDVSSFINIKGEAWDRLLLLHYAKKAKIKVSDREVVEWVAKQPVFVNQGKFDVAIYKLYVERLFRMNTREFEEEIRQFLTIDKVRDQVKSRISVGDDELKSLFDRENGERDVVYGILSWTTQKESVSVSDEELQKIYPILKNQLINPETKKALTFEEAREDLRKVMMKDKASELAAKRLNEIKTKIANPDDFEKILEAEGIELKTMDKFTKGSELPEIGLSENAEILISRLKEGEISEPFPVPTGAALLKVKKDRPASAEAFEKEKETFREKALQEKTGEELRKVLDGLRKRLKVNLDTMKKIFQTEEEKA